MDEVNEWLESWGIAVDRTRMRQYGNIFNGILRARMTGAIEDFAKKCPPEDYSSCFVDASAVRLIKKAFPKPRPRSLAKLIKRGLEGTYLLRQEKSQTAKACDYLFELMFASYLRLRRIPVLLNPSNDAARTDLVARVAGYSFDMECKRTQSVEGLLGAVEDGIKQLNRVGNRFERHHHARRSLVVVDISKLCFTGSTLLEFPALPHLSTHVKYTMECAVLALEREMRFNTIADSLVIILHLKIPAFVREAGCLWDATKLYYTSPCSLDSPDGVIVTRLMERIGPGV
jgi:hypothetical protein